MNQIVVIGDSHSQLFANIPNFKRGLWVDSSIESMFDVRWLGPVTYWRLCRDQNNFLDLNNPVSYTPYPGMTVTTKCEASQNILISLGEIDIRCNIQKHNTDPINNIDHMLIRLEEYLRSHTTNYKVHLLSIIPPIRKKDCISENAEFPFIGSDEDRASLTLYFNTGLQKVADTCGVGYFDLHSLYCDQHQLLNVEMSDRIVHAVKTPQLEQYIKNYFNI